jgi:hypothetical protein
LAPRFALLAPYPLGLHPPVCAALRCDAINEPLFTVLHRHRDSLPYDQDHDLIIVWPPFFERDLAGILLCSRIKMAAVLLLGVTGRSK